MTAPDAHSPKPVPSPGEPDDITPVFDLGQPLTWAMLAVAPTVAHDEMGSDGDPWHLSTLSARDGGWGSGERDDPAPARG